jgi:hypothetical protein
LLYTIAPMASLPQETLDNVSDTTLICVGTRDVMQGGHFRLAVLPLFLCRDAGRRCQGGEMVIDKRLGVFLQKLYRAARDAS